MQLPTTRSSWCGPGRTHRLRQIAEACARSGLPEAFCDILAEGYVFRLSAGSLGASSMIGLHRRGRPSAAAVRLEGTALLLAMAALERARLFAGSKRCP